jgi:outer membrane protein assembly factor BamB
VRFPIRHALVLLSGLSPSGISPALGAACPQRAAQSTRETGEDSEPRPFRIPDHAAAKSRMDRAEEHASAGRWSEALAELQAVIEEHRGDLLAGERPLSRAGEPSLQPVHPGASRRARERLLRLPPQARALYRERHGLEAAAAFEGARERGDRRALAEVARRWPLTDAAQRAWWALGDLELERGEEDKARSAWGRGLSALLEVPDLDLPRARDWTEAQERLEKSQPSDEAAIQAPIQTSGQKESRAGALRRIALAREELEALESAPARSAPPQLADGLHPASTGLSSRPPVRELESWPEPFVLPEQPVQRLDALFPARAGDALLVSTSLRLLALHAWSGTLLWDSGEPAGWEDLSPRDRLDFFEGIDKDAALIAPAAGGRVALAVLQIPISFVESFKYSSNVPVTTRIPDRRLFAFDLESGRRLWSHEPPPGWDGESGGFTQRMSVAGPPTVCGTRVLAPCYRMQGRLDYHVGCFDLETGALLWSTALISGQRELNMFGRAEHEFSAPPLVVSGDRVIALTQLGTIAALDLFTGELLWETLYDQIPLPKNITGGFKALARRPVWKNAPPAIAEGVVVATPFDSDAMVGIELSRGGLLWSVRHDRIERIAGTSGIDLLVGARPGTVFVSGGDVAAISARSGLRLSAPDLLRWSYSDDDMQDGSPPWRPVLAGERIVIPLKGTRVEIDVETGRKTASAAWIPEGTGGNLVVGPGEVCALSIHRVAGWFDWDLLTERARAEISGHEDDSGRALALGRLLADRGAAEWQRGQADAARAHLAEAEAVLDRALAGETALAGESYAERSPLAVEMHRALRSQARLRAGLADRAGALAALRRARTLAPDATTLRDTLLEELALLRTADGGRDPAYADALAAVERCCADLPLVCDATPAETPDATHAPSPTLPRFVPMVGSIARRDWVPCEMPVGLWVLFERIAAASAGGDSPAELAGLHGVLERYAEIELPQGSAGALAGERIGRLVREGRSAGYEVFEARAQKLLDEALAARDAAKLARIGRLFPHSRAAERADDQQLAWAMESGDTASVARIVQAQIPLATPGSPGGGWRLADANEREVRVLLRLSSSFARAGNRELATELLRTLAVAHGGVRSDLDGDGGRTLAELAAGIARWTPPDPAPPPGRFRQVTREGQRLASDWEILGRFQLGEDASGESRDADEKVESYAALRTPITRDRRAVLVTALVVPSKGNPDVDLAFEEVPLALAPAPLGPAVVAWSRRTALAPGRILVATGAGVAAVDGQGHKTWEWRPDGAAPTSISLGCAAGIAIVSVDLYGGRRYLAALDAHSGVELWRVPILDPGLAALPLLSSNRVVLLPVQGRKRAVALDLFTGREALSFELDTPVRAAAPDDAWIEDDLLIVPWIQAGREPERNHVLAYDLASGERAWRVAFGDDLGARGPVAADRESPPDARELVAVLQRPRRTWLLVRSSIATAEKPASAAIYELSTRIGALSPLASVRIGASDRVLGLVRPGRLALSSTILFLLGGREGSHEARLRAVDLAGGEMWSQALTPAFEDLLQPSAPFSLMPQPALSDGAVLLAYSVMAKGGVPSLMTTIECLDRGSGRSLSSLSLSPVMGRCDSLKIFPLGGGLLVRGQGGVEVLR